MANDDTPSPPNAPDTLPRRTAPDARTNFQLAAAAGCDPRTSRRALNAGLNAVRSSHHRARIAEAARSLGIAIPDSAPPRDAA